MKKLTATFTLFKKDDSESRYVYDWTEDSDGTFFERRWPNPATAQIDFDGAVSILRQDLPDVEEAHIRGVLDLSEFKFLDKEDQVCELTKVIYSPLSKLLELHVNVFPSARVSNLEEARGNAIDIHDLQKLRIVNDVYRSVDPFVEALGFEKPEAVSVKVWQIIWGN